MEPSLLFTTAFFVGLSGAMAPGPVTVVLTRQALKRGFRAAPLITLGHAFLELIMLSLLLFGLGNLLTGRLAALVGLLGGGMLIWMGQAMIRSPLEDKANKTRDDSRETSPIVAGVIATAGNPYWFIWWGTVGVGYISLSKEHGFLGVLSFFTGHILSDLFWLSFLALALVTGKRFITDGIYRIIMRSLGCALILLAIYFIWSSIQLL